MAKKTKRRVAKKTNPITADPQTAALNRHSIALQRHTAALGTAAIAHGTITAALRNSTAALIATKPRKSFNQKTVDAAECISQWLMQAKGVSQPDSTNPAKNMATDFHIGSPQEMQLCLEAVQACMAAKGDYYHLDTTSPKANQHLNTLVTSSLGIVVADIVANTT